MPRTAHRLVFVALIATMISFAYGINYMYLSDEEQTSFGDRIRFWHEDTCTGPVRSNWQIAIMEDPTFYDFVIQGGLWTDFEQGSGYNPRFLGPDPLFRAPNLPFPENAERIREQALEQGLFFNIGDSLQANIRVDLNVLHLFWTQIDPPYDTLLSNDILLPEAATVFFEAPLRISGTVGTELILGASGRIGLEDNIRYATSAEDYPWPPTPGHLEKFALISENEIKILNTPANGRDNSGGPGPINQPNIDLKDIVLSGIYVALNESFTFENHNDADSGNYQGPTPDERGTIYLWGSLMQQRRHYVHRSNHGGTGYGKIYRYDEELRFWDVPLWNDTLSENQIEPAGIDFGEVLIGDTLWREVTVTNDFIPVWLSPITVISGFGFFTAADSLAPDWEHAIQVGFSPLAPGLDLGELVVDIPYYDQSSTIALEGIGITMAADDPPIPSTFSVSVFPNPFNSRTTFSFSLPTGGAVELKLFDIHGREAARVIDGSFAPGVHMVNFDAATLSSGVYFASLSTPSRVITEKILLIK